MKEYSTDKIRNICLMGHGGVGKTSLSEALIFNMGETNRMGTINEGTTASDYHSDEIERKISISSALLHGGWKELKVNVLDTPGYSDFMGDTRCSLRVADLAVVVLSGVEGVEVGTEIGLGFADEYGVPRLFFVNRMDNEHSDFNKALQSAKERYGTGVVAIQMPVNPGEGFNKIVDLLNMKLLTYGSQDGKATVGEIPPELKEKAQELRDGLIEAAAESDDKLMESFFEAGTLTPEQLIQGLRKGILTRTVKPVLCGSATKNTGIQALLDFVCEFGPSPADFIKVSGTKPGAKDVLEKKVSVGDSLSALVFKTISEAHVGELSLVKVMSGVLQSGSEVSNSTQGSTEKVGQIYLMNGKNRKEIGQLNAGDIGALVKLKKTSTGDTLCDKRNPIQFERIHFLEPVINVAITPKSRGDEDKISSGLHTLHDEDPSFTIFNDPELHQMVLSGQGELHLTVILKRLRERFGVEVTEKRPKVPYRETITGKADEKYRHKKQTGGAGQFAEVWMRIEPLARGEGFVYENQVKGGAISGPFIPAIEKGIRGVLETGPVAGYKVVDVKAIVYDGKEHPVDSKEIAFQTAGREVFKACVLNAKPILLEPIYNVEVKIPESYMGDVMGDLSSRRGKIMGMDSQGHFQIIKAQVPLADLDRYATTLRSITSGRGIYSRTFSHYDPVPKELVNKIIEDSKAEKEKEAEK